MYSRKEVKLLVSNNVKEYELAINHMMIFMKSCYAISKGINIFLSYHVIWAKKAKQILEEIEIALEKNVMDKSIVFSFNDLINECVNEHKNIEDTYNRLSFSKEQGFSEFEHLLMRLRELCDGISYLDEMVTTLETYCKEGTNVMNNTNNFFGNATGIQIQQGTTNSSQNQNVIETFDYEKVVGVISTIGQYDTLLDNEYKQNAKIVRDILSEIEKLATQKKESGKIKTLLIDLKNLSIGISGSIIASGIVSQISAFL